MLAGGQKHEDFIYPEEEYYYYQFASRFGWTPNQVDDLPAATADWLVAIGSVVDRVQAERSET